MFIILAQTPPQQGPQISDLVVLGVIWLAIMYFLMIRPQRVKAKKHKETVDALKVGDTIITQGGLYGIIQKVETNTFLIEIAQNTCVKVVRSSVQVLNLGKK